MRIRSVLITFIFSFIILTLFLSILTFHNVVQSTVSAELSQYDLVPKHEKLTELYFDNHENLPKQIEKGQSNDFTFVIHNFEHETVTYLYALYTEVQGKKELLTEGTVTLKHDDARRIFESFTMLEDVDRMKIIVTLKNKNQSIHFWMGEEEVNAKD